MQHFLRVHLRVYIGAIVVLFIAQFFLSDGWWLLGLALVWGFVLFLHYMFVKSTNIDDGWANRRADDVTDKAYDAGHIDNIRDRYTRTGPSPDTTPDDAQSTSGGSTDSSRGGTR